MLTAATATYSDMVSLGTARAYPAYVGSRSEARNRKENIVVSFVRGRVEGREAIVANITSLLKTGNMDCSRGYAASSHIATMKCMPSTPRFHFHSRNTQARWGRSPRSWRRVKMYLCRVASPTTLDQRYQRRYLPRRAIPCARGRSIAPCLGLIWWHTGVI